MELTKNTTALVVAALLSGLAVIAAGPHYSAWAPAGQTVGPLVDPPASDDGNFCFTKDGRGLYFSSTRAGGIGRFDIWVTRWDEGTGAWGSPINLGPTVNSSLGDFTPALSRDEHWLFFASNRPGTLGQRDLYASYREHTHDDLGWGPATHLGALNTTADEFGVTYFDGAGIGPAQLIFGSTRGGDADFDLYTADIYGDGSLGPAVPVVELSTAHQEMMPSIRHDGLELFFASARPGTLGGLDLWAVTRESVLDPWSEPVNLGAGVNTAMDELYPTVSADSFTLVFYRGVLGSPALPATIWMSTRTKTHPE
jgi:hypothetical protein